MKNKIFYSIALAAALSVSFLTTATAATTDTGTQDSAFVKFDSAMLPKPANELDFNVEFETMSNPATFADSPGVTAGSLMPTSPGLIKLPLATDSSYKTTPGKKRVRIVDRVQ